MRTKHKYTQTHTHTTAPFPLKGLTPPGWLEAFVSPGQRLSQLRWCHHRLSRGSKPLSSRTTTKKSLCSIEPTCIRENEGFFRSFLLQHVTFFSVFTPSPLSLFRDPCFFFSISLLSTFYFALFLFHPGSSCLLSLRIFTFLFFVVVFSLPC